MRGLLIGILLLSSLNLHSQEDFDYTAYQKQYKLILKTNPFNILWGAIAPFCSEYRLSGEYAHGLKQSSQASVSYLGKNVLWKVLENSGTTLGTENLIFRGFRLQASHRFFLFSTRTSAFKAPEGFYLGPHLSFAQLKIADRYYNQFQGFFQATYFNANAIAGIQFSAGNIFIDINAGIGYKNNYWIEQLATRKRIVPPDELGFGEYFKSPIRFHLGLELGFSL